MLQKFKEFTWYRNLERVRQELTVVALIDGNIDSPGHVRTYTLMKDFARAGVFVICLHSGEQATPIEKPLLAVPNFLKVQFGQDIRHLFRGRLIMWTDNPQFEGTLKTAAPNLIVYDDRQKGNTAEDTGMYKLADLVFSPVLDDGSGSINFVPSSVAGATKALRMIQQTPDRKPPRK